MIESFNLIHVHLRIHGPLTKDWNKVRSWIVTFLHDLLHCLLQNTLLYLVLLIKIKENFSLLGRLNKINKSLRDRLRFVSSTEFCTLSAQLPPSMGISSHSATTLHCFSVGALHCTLVSLCHTAVSSGNSGTK